MGDADDSELPDQPDWGEGVPKMSLITKVLKPEELNAVKLVEAWRGVMGTAEAGVSLLDLNERVLDFLVEEGILG